jgi:site-specific DNA recombinase
MPALSLGDTMKTCAIYARVSTEDQRENGTSLESQTEACRKYAEQNDYTVVEVFKESRSGASLNRPMLDQVRELVRAGAVETVIFYALDRLSRDETDMLILAREFRNHGAELKCATVALEDTPQGQFLLTMLAAVGKLERAGILERTMRGKRQTVRNGKIMRTPTAIYGYSYAPGYRVEAHYDGDDLVPAHDVPAHYEICEAEAACVRRVFHWYCIEGLSLFAITQRLYAAGVPTKNGGRWSLTTVRNILTQEAYFGEYWWGKEGKSGSHRIPRPRSEWIGPVAVPSIITRDIYDAAQGRIQYNKANSMRNCSTEYLLRGLITCPLCGRRYRAAKKVKAGKTQIYYSCPKQSQSVPGEMCPSARLNGRRAEEEVWKWVVNKLSDKNFIKSILEGSDEEARSQIERDEADLRTALKLRAELDNDENMQIDLYSKHAISFDKFMERKAVRAGQAQGIDTRIREIQERQASRMQAVQDVRSAAEIVEKVQRGMPKRKLLASLPYEYKRAVLDALHIKVTALESGDVFVTGYISSDLLKLADQAGVDKDEEDEGERETVILDKERQRLVHRPLRFSPSDRGALDRSAPPPGLSPGPVVGGRDRNRTGQAGRLLPVRHFRGRE